MIFKIRCVHVQQRKKNEIQGACVTLYLSIFCFNILAIYVVLICFSLHLLNIITLYISVMRGAFFLSLAPRFHSLNELLNNTIFLFTRAHSANDDGFTVRAQTHSKPEKKEFLCLFTVFLSSHFFLRPSLRWIAFFAFVCWFNMQQLLSLWQKQSALVFLFIWSLQFAVVVMMQLVLLKTMHTYRYIFSCAACFHTTRARNVANIITVAGTFLSWSKPHTLNMMFCWAVLLPLDLNNA